MTYDKKEHLSKLEQMHKLFAFRESIFGSNLLLLCVESMKAPKKWNELLNSYLIESKTLAETAGFNWHLIDKHVRDYIESQKRDWASFKNKKSKEPPLLNSNSNSEIENILNEAKDRLFASLVTLPPSIEKAQNALIFELNCGFCINGEPEYLYPETLQVLGGIEPELVEKKVKKFGSNLLNNGDIQAPKYMDIEWDVAWIRFAEKNKIKHSKDLINQLSQYVEDVFQGYAEKIYARSILETPICEALQDTLRVCWICSHSYQLKARVEQQVGKVLNMALTWQTIEGAWPNARPEIEKYSATTTALAVSCLQRYGHGTEWNEAIEQGIAWLLKNPNEQSGWGNPKSLGGVNDLNLATTVIVLDAMRRQGIPLEHQVIEMAELALINAQTPSGMWADLRGYAPDYFTTLVLGYFQRREQRLSKMNEAMILGRDLLFKARSLHNQQFTTDKILALIALYHGLEYILYGFLKEHGQEIRRNNGETIGLIEARNLFNQLAKQSGWIRENSSLPYSENISELKAKRDEVIHRMSQINSEAVDGFLMQVWAFVERFDYKVLGYTLLE